MKLEQFAAGIAVVICLACTAAKAEVVNYDFSGSNFFAEDVVDQDSTSLTSVSGQVTLTIDPLAGTSSGNLNVNSFQISGLSGTVTGAIWSLFPITNGEELNMYLSLGGQGLLLVYAEFPASFDGNLSDISQYGVEYLDPSTDQFLARTASLSEQPAVATTPLPAALPMMLTGLGALGLFGWRKRRKHGGALVDA